MKNVRVFFEKHGPCKYISHLDTNRVMLSVNPDDSPYKLVIPEGDAAARPAATPEVVNSADNDPYKNNDP